MISIIFGIALMALWVIYGAWCIALTIEMAYKRNVPIGPFACAALVFGLLVPLVLLFFKKEIANG